MRAWCRNDSSNWPYHLASAFADWPLGRSAPAAAPESTEDQAGFVGGTTAKGSPPFRIA